jgi:hypothetical protein
MSAVFISDLKEYFDGWGYEISGSYFILNMFLNVGKCFTMTNNILFMFVFALHFACEWIKKKRMSFKA